MNTFDAPTSGAEEYVHDNRIDLKFIAGVLFLGVSPVGWWTFGEAA